MRHYVVWIALAGMVSWGAAAGEKPSRIKQPPAGTFKMRPELVGKHPRLYFTREDLPELARRAKGPSKFFADRVKKSFGSRFSRGPGAKVAGWERYLYGFWGLTGADMLYVTGHGDHYRDIAKRWVRWNLDQKDWVKDDLVPMDILSGLSITYDILYDEFTEAERKELRARIFEAMKFIHGRFFVGQYWTGDYQNNHMHNRLHALANASFAIYGDDPDFDSSKYADMALDQWRQVCKWLSEDGSTHEGPGYWSYGHHWLVRTSHVMEHVTGEKTAALTPHFATSHWYRIYMTCPGWKKTFGVGDAGDGPPGNLTTITRAIAEGRDGPGMTVLRRWMQMHEGQFYQHPAMGLLWHDAGVKPEPLEKMPLHRFWPDLEMLSIRSSWQDDATSLVFKCGPPGGHRMQKLRGSNWANVAHSHPDQNHFLLFAHGKLLAEDDGYPKKKKMTRSHNTISIDGKGGPREETGWYQPFDYKRTAFMRDVFLSGPSAFATGDAGRLYDGAEKALRHIAFVEGGYCIVLDDLVSAGGKDRDFEWRLHKDGDWREAAKGRFTVSDGDVSLDIRFLMPGPEEAKGKFLPAELTARPCLVVTQRGKAARFLSVLVPQKVGKPDVAPELLKGTGCTAIKVAGHGHTDLFALADAPGSFEFGDVKASGAAAIVRKSEEGEVLFAMLVRGTSLKVGETNVLGATTPANLSWRVTRDGAVVEAEAPYKGEGKKTRLQIGGLPASASLPVAIGAEAGPRAKSSPAGIVRVEVDLAERTGVAIGKDALAKMPPREPRPAVAEPGKAAPEDGKKPGPAKPEPPAGPTEEDRAAAKAAEGKLRRAVIDGVEGGRLEKVSLRVAGQTLRAKVTKADDEGVWVSVGGTEMKIRWAGLSAADFLSVAKKYSDDAGALSAYERGSAARKK